MSVAPAVKDRAAPAVKDRACSVAVAPAVKGELAVWLQLQL